MEAAKKKIIVGLDVRNASQARQIVEQLPDCTIFKIGPHFRHDPTMGIELLDRDFRNGVPDEVRLNPFWFDDSKHFDIEATVSAAIHNIAHRRNESAGDAQFLFSTVHAHYPVLQAAVKAAKGTQLKILAVPLMTSFSRGDLEAFYNYVHPEVDFVVERTLRAIKAGCHGAICSVWEVAPLRAVVPSDFLLIVPGTRPALIPLHDHKRSGTPEQAIRDGADYLVFSRPIICAENPREAFDSIAREIHSALSPDPRAALDEIAAIAA